MDAFDPLADAPPPRYAVESDDEDEYTPSSTRSASDQPPDVTVQFTPLRDTPLPLGNPLLVVSGEAGLRWATMVHLGEQHARIHVNTLPVGLLFCPSWTHAVVVVSEAETRTRLPRFAMTTYTTAIIERLQPTSVAILDSYATKLYISPRVIYQDSAPIRYLSTRRKQPVDDPGLELFAPPNLLQSTAASLLNQLFLRSASGDTTSDVSAVILLLPCPKVLPPPPTTLDGRGTAGEFPDTNWDRDTLEKAHRWLFSVIGEEVGELSLRARAELATRPLVSRSTLREVGEGSMYI